MNKIHLKMEAYKEGILLGYPNVISYECTQKILEQMEKNICKIRCKYGDYGTGFLSLIPFPDKSRPLPVLITNNHILTLNDIRQGKIIEFSINNDKNNYKILIDNLRKVYTNIINDITFIEIKHNDGLNFNIFLEIDEMIYKDNLEDIYIPNSIYLLHYPHGTKVEFSFGKIKNIEENNIIKHLCQTEAGSSGSPILNLLNFKVMGIHVGYERGQNWNLVLY